MAKHFASKKNDDMEMLLSDSQMPWARTEGGCHKSTLIKALFFTSILLVLVSVSWFLHYNVFLDKDHPAPAIAAPLPLTEKDSNPPQGQSAPDCPQGPPPKIPDGLLDMDLLVEIAKNFKFNMSEIPSDLLSLAAVHFPEINKHEYKKVLQDKALVAALKKYLYKLQMQLLSRLEATTAHPAEVTTTPASVGDDGNMTGMDHDGMEGMDHSNDDYMEGMHHDADQNDKDHNKQVERQHRVS